MPLTPVEIRHIDLRRAWFRGYRKPGVDGLLTEIADSFEEVWRERADLSDRLEEDMVKIRAQLRTALESLGEWPGEKESELSATRPVIGEVTDSGIRKVAG